MFTLYLKIHNQTGLKYLGYTKNDATKYRGSGIYWKNHLKKYGNDVYTQILYQSNDIDEISEKGLEYSHKWNIVESKDFANFCFEDGNKIYGKANPNFRGHPQTDETRKKISQNNARTLKGKFGKDHPCYGLKRPDCTKYDGRYLIEWNKKNGPWNKGRSLEPPSEETKQKLSEAASKLPKEKVQCPHCKKIGGKPAMIRFHFDNCKECI